MVRLYGKQPYKIVLVHGGPGAIGSLKGFAKELNARTNIGVVEAIQSKYSIDELIEELHNQIQDNCFDKVTLIGHSWGAWLVALYSVRYPEQVVNTILVGSGPLEDKYVPEIGKRRMQNLLEDYRTLFQRLANNETTVEDMKRIPAMFEKSDNFCLDDKENHRADRVDSEMHNRVWSEATQLRSSGELLRTFKKIKSNLFIIQGSVDPHPAQGVIQPLEEIGVECETYILEKCGHSPFMEKHAKEKFYEILVDIVG